MQEVLLVRFGEVYLKGLNRPQFMRVLVGNVRSAVRPFRGRVWLEGHRIYVADMTDTAACARRVAKVFGIHSVSVAVQMEKESFEALCGQAAAMLRGKTGTFKIKARRADKRYPLDSPEICRAMGEYVLRHVDGLSVDVRDPEHELEVEIRDQATLHMDRIPGVGGMPMGTGGKACLLLSGGIDSPVAGYMIARRGVKLMAVHFHSFPYTSERARDKVVELARILSSFCGRIDLFVVPFTEIQMRIHQNCPEAYGTLIMRRQMMRIAGALAGAQGAQALITGESIGQVASQTMDALACTDDVAELPVFRPLIGFDKIDIITRAEEIGTFETSSLPYEDCCTVFTPKHPATHPKLERIRQAELLIGEDMRALVDAAVQGAERLTLRDGEVLPPPEKDA